MKMGDVPGIWSRLEQMGLTTVQACGDSARNVLCCPVAGVDAEEAFDAYPAARAVSEFFTGNREYANLPRKFKISVTGCRDDCAQAELQDIGLWPAQDRAGTVGFNVLVGGGLSDGARLASDIDVFVTVDQAVEVTRAIAQVYGELGNRGRRHSAPRTPPRPRLRGYKRRLRRRQVLGDEPLAGSATSPHGYLTSERRSLSRCWATSRLRTFSRSWRASRADGERPRKSPALGSPPSSSTLITSLPACSSPGTEPWSSTG